MMPSRPGIVPRRWGPFGNSAFSAPGNTFLPSDLANLLAWYDPSDSSTVFQERTGASATTPSGDGDVVGTISDKSGNDFYATADADDERPVRRLDGNWYLDHDLTDDGLQITITGSGSGGRAIETLGGHQIDKDVPLRGFEQTLPQLPLASWVANDGAFTDDEIASLNGTLNGDRYFMICQTNDLTLAKLRMHMANAETPVLRAVGANGVEATVTLGGSGESSLDLSAAGLTAPAQVYFPLVGSSASLEALQFNNNDLTGSFPDLSSNTALTEVVCDGNALTGSIPNLSSNTALEIFRCNINALTGSIPDISSNTSLLNFQVNNNNLTGSIPDPSSNTSLTEFRCDGNSLTGSIPDLSSNTSLTELRCNGNALDGWGGTAMPASLIEFRADGNSLPEATVDDLLAAFDTAGANNGDIQLEGGTNAAPSASGETSIDNLRGKGWTVTVTGGY